MRHAAAILAGVVLLQGCTGVAEPPADGMTAETRVERGPVRLTVRAQPAAVTVGEPLELVIEVVAAEGVTVGMPVPPDGGELGPFTVRDTQSPPDVPVTEGRRHRHTWTLDTFGAGDNEIPALTVTFVDGRPESATPTGPIQGELVSDPLTVSVRSVLAVEDPEQDLRDIKAEVRDFLGPDLASLWPLGLVIGAGLVVAALMVIMSRRRRFADLLPPVIPPGEWALGRLDDLERRKLVEQGMVHEFYFLLSDIVRQYLERRFELMAPERTTEEFLREARRSDVIADGHKQLLAEFLRAADMVKFALHEPSAAESGLALAAARGFVEETTETAAPAGAMEDAA